MLNFTRHLILQPNWQLVDLYCFDVHWSSLSIFGSSDPRYIILSYYGLLVFFHLYNLSYFKATKNNSHFVVHNKKHMIRCLRCGRWWQGYIHGRWTKSQQRSLSHLRGEGFCLTDLWRKTCDKNKRMFFFNGIISGCFQKYGYIPQNGWFRKPIKIDDLGIPLFLGTSIYHGSC